MTAHLYNAKATVALGASYEHADTLIRQVLTAAKNDADLRALRLAWQRLELGLRAHLRADERWLFQVLEAKDPAIIRDLLSAHRRIRRMLIDTGFPLAQGVVDVGAVRALRAVLRENASRKRETIYRWAAETLPRNTLDVILELSQKNEALLIPLELTRAAPPPRRPVEPDARTSAIPADRQSHEPM